MGRRRLAERCHVIAALVALIGVLLAAGCASPPSGEYVETSRDRAAGEQMRILFGDRVDRPKLTSGKADGVAYTQLFIGLRPGLFDERDVYRMLAWLHSQSEDPRLEVVVSLMEPGGSARWRYYTWDTTAGSLKRSLSEPLSSPYPATGVQLSDDGTVTAATAEFVQAVASGTRPVPVVGAP